ncbi:hypothetical protein OEZ85_005573 [Tetradesmus obliquus]|uniref:Uncharacterized protein n=1 Tax=Tetradesmus obliquus TaxID=3088 RepID=A0ABY8UJ42_TETOB|nr:hypothetical protein OEZ85_005573 [Tetradesmus obliquus]
MAEQQLPTQEERRQEVEQLSAAKLTDEVERVREQISKQLQANISQKQREEEQRRAAQQVERLKQIEAASARAFEAHKADEEKAYLTWLSEQKLDVKNGIPNRPMFKEEFEKHWKKKSVAVPAWDLGIFGTAPQAQPAPTYKKREDGSWRWERDYAASVYEQASRPLCKSSSRKLSALPPVEPAPAPDPDNALARLAAEVAEAASKEAAAVRQQRRREAGRMPKKTSSQHTSQHTCNSRTPGTHRPKRTARTSKDKSEQASPRHIEVHRKTSSEILSKAFAGSPRMSESDQLGQVPVHRWQSWDYSDPVYQIDRHPVCKSHSRKLSDLGAVQPVELAATAAAPKGAAAAAAPAQHQKQAALKAVLSPCLSAQQEQEEGPDTAAATEQAAPEIQ